MDEERIDSYSGDQTDLRSERVRNIIGDIPSILTRLGITIIFVVVILVLAGSYFVPYRTYYSKTVVLYSEPRMEMIKASEAGTVIIPMGVENGQVRVGSLIALFVNGKNKVDSLKARSTGKLTLNCSTQEQVSEGQLLALIIPNKIEKVNARLDVPAKFMDNISVGKAVAFIPNGMKKTLNGKIAYIYPLPLLQTNNDVRSTLLTFDYPLRFASGDTISYHPLLSGEARIFTGESKLFNIIFHFNN